MWILITLGIIAISILAGWLVPILFPQPLTQEEIDEENEAWYRN